MRNKIKTIIWSFTAGWQLFSSQLPTYPVPTQPCSFDKNTVLLADFEQGLTARSAAQTIKVSLPGEAVWSSGKFGKGFLSQRNGIDILKFEGLALDTLSSGTLEFWFKYQKLQPAQPPNKFPHMLSLENPSGDSCIFVLYRDDAYNLRFIQIIFTIKGEKPTSLNIAANFLEAEAWNHIGFFWRDKEITMFANGQLLPQNTKELPREVCRYFGNKIAFGGSLKTATVAGTIFDEIRISDVVRYDQGENNPPAAVNQESGKKAKISTADAEKDIWIECRSGGKSDFSIPGEALQNPSFEKNLQGWVVERFQGAQGRYKITSAQAQEGQNSVYLQKENGLGYISLRSAQPVELVPGEKYTFRAYYRADNVKYPMTSLLMRIEQTADSLDYIPNMDQGKGLSTQTAMINTPSGSWYKRLYNLKLFPETSKAYIHFIVIGNPAGVWIDNLTIEKYSESDKKWKETMGPYAPRVVPEGLVDKDELAGILEKAKPASAKLEKRGGITTLLINGQPAAPILHKPDGGNWAEHHLGKYFQEQNVKIHLALQNFDFRKGSSPFNNPLWTGPKEYAFDKGIEAIEQVIRGIPDGKVVLELCINSYKDFCDKYPDECWLNTNGQRGYRTGGHFVGFTDKLPEGQYAWAYSYLSEVWRQEVKEMLKDYLDFLKKTPYYKNIIGFMITGGHDGQFATRLQDYSLPAQAAFRKWLRKKYQTDAALAKAWNIPGLTFSQAQMPDFLDAADVNKFMYDPQTEMNKIDYRKFYYEISWDTTEFIAQTLKENAGKDVLCFRYFMAGLSHWPHATKSVTSGFFQSKFLDGVGPQPAYPFRQNSFTLTMRQVMESFHVNNKLCIMEFDQRTKPRSAQYPEINYLEQSVATNAEEWKDIHRKCLGEMIARGHGFWYYDMVSGWFHDPQIYQDIGLAMKYAAYLRDGKMDWQADVALIADEETDYRCPYTEGVGHPALDLCQRDIKNTLNQSGVPYDYYYFSDLKNNAALHNYKIYIFATTWYLSRDDRALINKLKNNGRVLIWLYAPGYYDEEGDELDNMAKLTGINIQGGEIHPAVAVCTAESTHPLGKNLQPLQGIGYLSRKNWLMVEKITYLDYLRFYAEDKGAAVIARFESDQAAAIAVKDLPGWRSIYIAQPGGISPDFLNNAAREAGAYVLCDPWISIEMNNNFICVHGTRAGKYTFRLRSKRTVKDLRLEKTISQNTNTFDYTIEAGKTYWFGLY